MESGINVFYYVVLFAFYSFWGWVVEVIYRSVTQRRFVNAGFLFGPFIPIYGFGAAAVVVLEYFFSGWHLIIRFIILGVALTAFEYLVGFLAEKIFKLKLWDYSENKLNLHGRVCLHFSLIWTVFAMIFIMFIHPATLDKVKLLDDMYVEAAAVLFLMYFAVDYTASLISLAAFRRKATYLYVEYLNLSNREIEKILYSFQRLRSAFPALNKYIDNIINNSIKE
ncbi:MAG: putative ABC transporter permease [Smithellaceae bacterium]